MSCHMGKKLKEDGFRPQRRERREKKGKEGKEGRVNGSIKMEESDLICSALNITLP